MAPPLRLKVLERGPKRAGWMALGVEAAPRERVLRLDAIRPPSANCQHPVELVPDGCRVPGDSSEAAFGHGAGLSQAASHSIWAARLEPDAHPRSTTTRARI